MALWKEYLMRKILYENRPSLQEERCLNWLQTRQECHICRDVCPEGVFDGPEPRWEYCDGCGICAAACPVRCLRPSALTAGSVLELYGRISGDVVFSCHQRDDSADLRFTCLSALPWELMALFALNGRVTLLEGECGDCFRKNSLSVLDKSLDRLKDFLGEEGYRERICRLSEPAQRDYRACSRREAFSMLFSKSRAAAAGLLPDSGELVSEGIIWRQLLAHRLRHLAPPRESGWDIPEFTDRCTACGVCTRLCPGEALRRIQGEEDEGGVWHMALIPWRCTACGVCTLACPEEGIKVPENRWLTDPSRPVIYSAKLSVCPRCKEPASALTGSKLCPRCAGELGKAIVWEDMEGG
ncbi:MAG: 4Fe-4S dicluster domain-containing protein [Clostridium sp.]|nr:4Fe-4S dicluster domain-containing protein [Clostridium sp.]